MKDEPVKQDKAVLLLCNCNHAEHQLIFKKISYTDEYLDLHDGNARKELEEEVFIDIHLSPLPFWKRVKFAIKYVFGYQSRYGAFQEIITTTDKLRNVVDQLDEK
jgi:hypothetical protein